MKLPSPLPLLLALAFLPACQSSSSSGGDVDTDTGTDSDTDTDTDSDTDSDTGPECTDEVWEGNYQISDVDDLENLAGYAEVTGDLEVHSTSLADLAGLDCLVAVGGSLDLHDNEFLTDVTALSGVTSVGNLTVDYCDSLADLAGLEGVTSVGGALFILWNDGLTSLEGLSSITVVDGDMWISGNDLLPDCEICDLLDQLYSGPAWLDDVVGNLEDDCTPVPDNCP